MPVVQRAIADIDGIAFEAEVTTIAAQLVEVHGSSLIVCVLQGNPARFFYEALGGKRVAHRHATMGGAPIEEIGFAWEDARSLVAIERPDQDGSIGRA